MKGGRAKLENFCIDYEQNCRGDFIYLVWLPTQLTWDTKAFLQPAPSQKPIEMLTEKL